MMTWTRGSQRKVAALIGFVLAFGLGGLLAGGAFFGGATQKPHTGLSISAGPLPDRCRNAPTTIEAAQALDPQVAVAPNSDLANMSSLNLVVWCPYPTLVERFQSGAWIVIEPNPVADPVNEFTQVSSDNQGVILTQVNGSPGIESSPDPSLQRPGAVEFVSGGDYVGVYGNGSIPLAGLIGIADSIVFPSTPSPSPSAGTSPISDPSTTVGVVTP